MGEFTPDVTPNAERATILTVSFAGGVTGKSADVVEDVVWSMKPRNMRGEETQSLPLEELTATIPVPVGNDNRMGVVVVVYKGWLDIPEAGFDEWIGDRTNRYMSHSVQYVPAVAGPPPSRP